MSGYDRAHYIIFIGSQLKSAETVTFKGHNFLFTFDQVEILNGCILSIVCFGRPSCPHLLSHFSYLRQLAFDLRSLPSKVLQNAAVPFLTTSVLSCVPVSPPLTAIAPRANHHFKFPVALRLQPEIFYKKIHLYYNSMYLCTLKLEKPPTAFFMQQLVPPSIVRCS